MVRLTSAIPAGSLVSIVLPNVLDEEFEVHVRDLALPTTTSDVIVAVTSAAWHRRLPLLIDGYMVYRELGGTCRLKVFLPHPALGSQRRRVDISCPRRQDVSSSALVRPGTRSWQASSDAEVSSASAP